jgi:Zn-dependent protease with chaperone function
VSSSTRSAQAPAVSDSRRAPRLAVPPWTLFWLASSLVITVPGQLPTWKESLYDLLGITAASSYAASGTGVLRLGEVVDLVPPLLLIAAIAAIIGAPLRGRFVARSYRLAPTAKPVIAEITDFTRSVAPGMEVRANVLRLDVSAFIYPHGFRRASLAVCGRLVQMWRRDREAAEAVIRHELSHRDRGDALLLGTVSPLEGLLRRWMWILIAFIVIPISVSWVAETTDFFRQVGMPGTTHKASQFLTLLLPGLLWALLASTAQLMAMITMPIAASWSAEIAADHHAAAHGRSAALARALQAPRSSGFRHWMSGRITHPPTALRRALAQAGTVPQVLAALVIYPVGWLVQLLWLLIMAASAYAGEHEKIATIISAERANIATYAHSNWSLWTAALVVALVWPALTPAWRFILTAKRPGG